MDFYKSLNPPQAEAVAFNEGALLVSAGAGTGKTRVLTTRIARLLAEGKIQPMGFMAVTFTNRAAAEMKHRIARMLGKSVQSEWIGTFHSIGLRILRNNRYRSGFTIIDAKDQLRLAKQIIKDRSMDPSYTPPAVLCGMIEHWKSNAYYPAQVPPQLVDSQYAKGKSISLYSEYQDRLKRANCLDFSDLLLESYNLIRTNPDIQRQYQTSFRHILVDEYQDTNTLQFLWLKLLVGQGGNICAVGDDDQCIYTWRGAEINNFLKFETHFKGAKIIRLEQNYRSTGHILAAAATLIAVNSKRIGKTLWTDAGKGRKVQACQFGGDKQEALFICHQIRQLLAEGKDARQIAVLLRTSSLTKPLEECFKAASVAYEIVGMAGFYDRMEIRDTLAWLRFAHNSSDDISLMRALERPRSGIGKVSAQKALALARSEGLSLFKAFTILASQNNLPSGAKRTIEKLQQHHTQWQKLKLPTAKLANQIIKDAGYLDHWHKVEGLDSKGRIDNVKTLLAYTQEFDSLAEFLENVSLVSEEQQDQTKPKIRIMTIHAAKGLEFDNVFLCGFDEGILPHSRTLEEGKKALEEERRLAHVALTRASQRAVLTHCQTRFLWGSYKDFAPSRFLAEMPSQDIEFIDMRNAYPFRGTYKTGGEFGADSSSDASGGDRSDTAYSGGRSDTAYSGGKSDTAYSGGNAQSRTAFSVGQQVRHKLFGIGTVAQIAGRALVIDFADEQRTVMRDYVSPF